MALAISHDGVLAVTSGADFGVCVWDLDEGELTRTLRGHTGAVVSAAFAGTADTVVTASHVRRGAGRRGAGRGGIGWKGTGMRVVGLAALWRACRGKGWRLLGWVLGLLGWLTCHGQDEQVSRRCVRYSGPTVCP